MRGSISVLWASLLVLLASSVVHATLIEYSLISEADDVFGSLPAGSTLTITFVYDSSQVDLAPGNAATGAYDLLSLSVSGGGETATFVDPIAGSGSLNILNASGPSQDNRLSLIGIVGSTFASTTGTLGGVAAQVLQVDLVDATDSVISSDALPGATLTAAEFTGLWGVLDGGVPNQTGLSSVTSLSGSVVPEPSTGALLATGLLAVGATRRRAALREAAASR